MRDRPAARRVPICTTDSRLKLGRLETRTWPCAQSLSESPAHGAAHAGPQTWANRRGPGARVLSHGVVGSRHGCERCQGLPLSALLIRGRSHLTTWHLLACLGGSRPRRLRGRSSGAHRGVGGAQRGKACKWRNPGNLAPASFLNICVARHCSSGGFTEISGRAVFD